MERKQALGGRWRREVCGQKRGDGVTEICWTGVQMGGRTRAKKMEDGVRGVEEGSQGGLLGVGGSCQSSSFHPGAPSRAY